MKAITNIIPSKILMPFRREIWEYQKSFVGTFAGVSALVLVVLLYAIFHVSGFIEQTPDFEITIEGQATPIHDFNFRIATAGYLSFIGFISLIVSVYYMLSSLFDDRRDRSILFWKSMPVSETQAVLTKLATGLFVIPLIALAIGALSLVINVLVVSLWLPAYTPLSFLHIWSGAEIFSAVWYEVVFIAVTGVWLAPFFAWFMFASAFSKKSPFLIAFIPPLVFTLFEKMFLGSATLIKMIGAYLPDFHLIQHTMADFDSVLQQQLKVFLIGPEIVYGLVVTVILTVASIWLRNNRYEI